jgi:hypothetical protein
MSTVNGQTPSEQGETPAAPVLGTPEYDQAMADKYTAAHSKTPAGEGEPSPDPAPDTPAEGDTPAGLTIKPEEKPEDKTEGDPEDKSAEEKPEDKTEGEAAAAIPAELFAKASEEFAASGELTEDTIKEFLGKGIPQEFIDTYVAGARALQAQMVTEAQGLVGGEDNWNAMMAWAKTLPEADIDAFNEAVVNPKTSKLAIQGLYSRYAAEHGSESPSAAAGAERGSPAGDVYQSKTEMTADMRDPRYAKDAAFRATVEQKIARSRKAGTLGPLGTAY